MQPKIKNVIAILAGLIIGSIVNMMIIIIGNKIIPLPPGTDTSTAEGLKAALPLFKLEHFIVPFLAHALGTFAGALLATFIAATHKKTIAFVIGCAFLIGGITMIIQVPSPIMFTLIDLLFAYIPMALMAYKIVRK